MQLSKNFRLSEFLVTSTGIANIPTKEVIDNIQKLVDNVLQPLRELYGKPIIITSGYRSPKVNKAVGGSTTSGHMLGTAADITAGHRHLNEKLYNIIRDNFEFRQLIDEYNFQWVHIEYREGDNKGQLLKIG